MSYIRFDNTQLINLEYSLSKELIRSNRAGAYAGSTILNSNTRKYHGLLVAPQPNLDDDNHVILSSFDETVIQHDTEFNLSVHKFAGEKFYPKGHRYAINFSSEPIPKLTYRVGGVVLTREMVLRRNSDRIMIKYTLLEAHSPTRLRFKPLLAFRNMHNLSKANLDIDTGFSTVLNGIRIRMYAGYTPLFMQFSKKVHYVHAPDWHFNFEYIREKLRGYDCHEDLYIPGFFETTIRKGESICFSAGTYEIVPSKLSGIFTGEVRSRTPRDSYYSCLVNSAQQFVVCRANKTEIIAGFPWYGRRGRDTFIALPGIMLATGNKKLFLDTVATMISEMQGPLFPNVGKGGRTLYNSADAPLWFFWALQQYASYEASPNWVWKKYSEVMKNIIEGFASGIAGFGIKMLENGLLSSGLPDERAVTWMDAVVEGKPVTPRIGLAVEVNALWYNALKFALQCATDAGDHRFAEQWEPVSDLIPNSFVSAFWSPVKKYLADCVSNQEHDWSVRPNMVIATSLPFCPIDENMRRCVLDKVRSELLTPFGLRTLSPNDSRYRSIYAGDQRTRDTAAYMGTAWPWLLGHYAEGMLRLHGNTAIGLVEKIFYGLESTQTDHAIGSISELYDGDPPHKPGGAISMAWSVAEIIRIYFLISEYKLKKT